MTRMVRRVKEAKRIARSLIRIEIFEGSPRTFIAELNLKESGFSKTAKVVLDARCAGSEIVRFEFGTIARIAPEQPLVLNKLTGKHVRFALKVIDTSQEIGRILGIADNITPVNSAKKNLGGLQGILPIEPSAELGEQLWRLEFGRNEEDVFLLVDNTADEGLPEKFANEATIGSLVYPSIIREILWKACVRDEHEEDDEQEGWKSSWLKFAKKFDPDKPPAEDKEGNEGWIERVVQVFCEQHRLKQEYFKHITKEET